MNAKERSDLFQVLKGGSNNFGIITRFELFAFEQGQLWGGTVAYSLETGPQQYAAFVRFTDRIKDDPFGSLLLTTAFIATTKESIIVNIYDYTKPVVNASAYDEFFAIQPELSNTMRIAPISDLINELNSADGFRFVSHFLSYQFSL